MDQLKKIGNVFGIIAAWLLSIVLVVMLIAAPMLLTTLSVLDADTITKAVTDTLTESIKPVEKDSAADFSVSKLSSTTEISDEIDMDAAGSLLEDMFSDQISPEILEAVLSSKVAKELIETYTEDVANAFLDSGKDPQLDAQKLKTIVNDNMGEILDVVSQIQPDLTQEQADEVKSMILEAVDENAEEIIALLPKPEEIRQEIMDSTPELEIVFQILAMKDTIKLAIVGVLALLSLLIFLCRLPGLRGFRWLATDLFVGTGFNGLLCGGLLAGGSIVKELVAGEPAAGALVESLLSAFTNGMLVRTVVMLVSGGVLLTVYIIIKKTKKKKTIALCNEDLGSEEEISYGEV